MTYVITGASGVEAEADDLVSAERAIRVFVEDDGEESAEARDDRGRLMSWGKLDEYGRFLLGSSDATRSRRAVKGH